MKTKLKKLVTFNKGTELRIDFPYDFKTVQLVKTLPFRRFITTGGKYWVCPYSKEVIQKLQEWGFEIAHEVLRIGKERYVAKNLPTIKIPGLNGTLRKYQNEGVHHINKFNGRALLADDMGLGKTIQSIAWLQLHQEVKRVIIICPSCVKYNWRKEMLQWMGVSLNIMLLEGRSPRTLPIDYDYHKQVVIVNYDIIWYWREVLNNFNPDSVILDEAHKIKNLQAKRTKATRYICKQSQNVIGLTGTPIENRPSDVYSIASLIQPKLFVNEWSFKMRYCGPKKGYMGHMDFSGVSNIDELHSLLISSMMIRRLKEDVLSDLPPKEVHEVVFPLSNEKEYQKAENDIKSWIIENKGVDTYEKASNAIALTKLNYLKQIAAKGKIIEICHWIDDFLENTNKKLVVFGVHKDVLDIIYKEYEEIAVKLDGTCNARSKNDIVHIFQNNTKCRLFISNIEAGGVGTTLTKASDMLIIEFPWNPSKLDQAIDRIYRIGQTENVHVRLCKAENTIDEKLLALINEKRKVNKAIIDGEEVEEQSILKQLLKSYE